MDNAYKKTLHEGASSGGSSSGGRVLSDEERQQRLKEWREQNGE